MPSPNKLIEVATSELGYLEKKSNKDLDSKTGNAGSSNFTKYWRDLSPSLNGSYWCDVFVDWCFVTAYGKDEAMRLECGGTYNYYTPDSAQCYKNAGRWKTTPEIGAQIFFRNSERINHTGIVVSFTDKTVTTIEGNTSGGSAVVANGGGVVKKTYQRSNSKIAGYGCPDYTEDNKMITPTLYINETGSCAKMYKDGHFKYGDTHAWPPCADGITACDRGAVARPLFNLGYEDQPRIPNSTSGITVKDIEPYLHGKKGWKKITKKADLKAGDIIVTYQNGQPYHCFLITKYNPKTEMCDKYDFGSQPRIDAGGFFQNVKLIEWSNQSFYAGFRVPESSEPKRLPTKGTPRTLASAINKSYVVDIKNGSMNLKANAQLYKTNGSTAQQFIIEDVKDGFVRIVNKKSGLVLDVQAGKAGNNVWQYEWNGSKAQLWKMRMNADMTVTFESAINSAYVLDVHAGKAVNGQNIGTYKWNGTKAQKWTII